jgi:hypothetical protein
MLVLLYIPFTLSVLSIQCYSTAAHVADARRDLSSSSAGAISAHSTEELQCAVEAVSYDNDDSAVSVNPIFEGIHFKDEDRKKRVISALVAAKIPNTASLMECVQRKTNPEATALFKESLELGDLDASALTGVLLSLAVAASEETLITRAVYEWANAVRGNMISEIVYDFRSEPSIQEGSGRAPNKTSEIVYDFGSEPSIQESSGRAPNKTSDDFRSEPSIREGSGTQ